MKIETGPLAALKTPLLVLPVIRDTKDRPRCADAKVGKAVQDLVKEAVADGDLRAESSAWLVPAPKGFDAARLLLVAVGAKAAFDEETARRLGSTAARHLRERRGIAFDLRGLPRSADGFAEALVTGFEMTRYRFDRYLAKTSRPRLGVSFVCDEAAAKGVRAGVRRGSSVANGVSLARDVGNLPGNQGGPLEIVREARQLARRIGASCQVLDQKKMEALGMGALLGVAMGSVKPPRLIVIDLPGTRKNAPCVCLVGKGVTFDSGGISLKPSAGMEKMRHDKCGAAAVLGAMGAAADARLPFRVVGLLGVVENMPDGGALRPGDVVHAMDGTSIEVMNTDAEGRLVLADTLLYARRYEPELIVDLATLTGAVGVALGEHRAAVLGTDDALVADLVAAGEETGERLWRLPLGKEYANQIKGKHTTLRNLGGRHAGTITAAEFLKHFAGEVPWAHLDIAAVAWDDGTRPYNKGKGATGFGVRLLSRFLEQRVARRNA